MGLKNLFTVPKGEKVTEKCLRRVLAAFVCSILLCMSCLVGTTWAWFVVTVENPGNEIAIAVPTLHVTVAEPQFVHVASRYTANTDVSYTSAVMRIENANPVDDLNKKTTLYATFTLECEGKSTVFYVTLNEENGYGLTLNLKNDAGKTFKIRWLETWLEPVGVSALAGDTITLNSNGSAEITTAQTTEPSTETTEATTSAQVPGDPTENG